MNALTLLKQDHGNVETLFKQFEATEDPVEQRRIVDHVIEQLSVHAAIEEQLFYPAIRECAPDATFDVLEGLEEHHIVKWTLSGLEKMAPTEERFAAKVTVLIESVRHHVEEEENDMFPKVREGMKATDLEKLGDAMAEAKQTAPTRPHPRTPDTPPLNLVIGQAAAVVDKAMTTARDVVSEVVGGVLGGRKR
jgi:hemerythrin superfamily protein